MSSKPKPFLKHLLLHNIHNPQTCTLQKYNNSFLISDTVYSVKTIINPQIYQSVSNVFIELQESTFVCDIVISDYTYKIIENEYYLLVQEFMFVNSSFVKCFPCDINLNCEVKRMIEQINKKWAFSAKGRELYDRMVNSANTNIDGDKKCTDEEKLESRCQDTANTQSIANSSVEDSNLPDTNKSDSSTSFYKSNETDNRKTQDEADGTKSVDIGMNDNDSCSTAETTCKSDTEIVCDENSCKENNANKQMVAFSGKSKGNAGYCTQSNCTKNEADKYTNDAKMPNDNLVSIDRKRLDCGDNLVVSQINSMRDISNIDDKELEIESCEKVDVNFDNKDLDLEHCKNNAEKEKLEHEEYILQFCKDKKVFTQFNYKAINQEYALKETKTYELVKRKKLRKLKYIKISKD